MSMEVSFGYQIQNDRDVIFEADETLYPLDSIYGVSYLFVARCYVFLERNEDQKVRIRLRTKEASTEEALEALVGEFANELLNQVIRFKVGEATAQIREYTMARAFVSSPAQASIDALLAELDAEELEDDDLEISVPWEDSDV